ncbi:MAG: DSBA oxidoreductase [Parcubacteria group bacterium Gr01-1014_48]|nr:MAG: DSBA oxidoreductase [Parcubacteria group bacterium Greene0416_14]TSC73798.1 MAG: DSBA oxidoreductase [Parcubacteria group bacterium Gr01-1014_48]TSD01084.1 MAG: DSBA oxidoreductase [Parcubacteria group bacterium Greene1014_15]TSD08053.1 MAG: DSBA oxidoreductase [Parcubacteria group bacterium Greene0714_4]
METDTPIPPTKDTPEIKMEEKREQKREPGGPNPFLVPVAVLIAGAMISGAIFFSLSGKAAPAGQNVAAVAGAQASSAEKVIPVNKDDHVFGNPGAEITLIEFSDFQCPFCAQFHPTLERIVSESNGKINWVYRHFPLTSIHPNAMPAAIASECVAQEADNDAFWKFAGELFKNQQELGAPLYEKLAKRAGISKNDFSTCIASPKIEKQINDDMGDAVNSGGQGTPYVIIINKKGETSSFSGALPYAQVIQAIDKARGN